PATLGKTQDLSIYKQLAYGIRYFDLRPGWDGSDLYIYHTVRGPKLSEVLDDVARFMQEGHRELVILKLSHYVSFDDDVYQRMVRQIRDRLGRWLIVEKPPEKRLAEVPIGDFLTQK